MRLLLLLIALYIFFSIVLFSTFHNLLSFFVAGIIAALIGTVVSGGKL